MVIPSTSHKKIKYRNGEEGYLLTTQRDSDRFPVMTLRFKGDSLIYHNTDGKYLGLMTSHELDIVEIES